MARAPNASAHHFLPSPEEPGRNSGRALAAMVRWRPFAWLPFAATIFAIGALGCMRPPPQLPCNCPPNPCQSPASADPSNASTERGAWRGFDATSATGESADQRALTQRFATTRPLDVLRGEASYYGDSLAGNKTASGEVYDPGDYTAAHRTLPFGTLVRVVRTDRGAPQPVYVRITDRGPFGERKRIIDLSRAAAEQLDMIRDGVIEVRVEVVAYPPDP